MPGWQGYLCSPNASTTPLKYSRFRDCSVLVFLLGAAASLKPRVLRSNQQHPFCCCRKVRHAIYVSFTLMRLFDEEQETGRILIGLKFIGLRWKKNLTKDNLKFYVN